MDTEIQLNRHAQREQACAGSVEREKLQLLICCSSAARQILIHKNDILAADDILAVQMIQLAVQMI